MKIVHRSISVLYKAILVLFLLYACKKDSNNEATPPVVTPPPPVDPPVAFDINSIVDNYASITSFGFRNKWSVYNVHDPSIKKFGEYYYCYSTDAAYGYTDKSPEFPAGIQVRKSKDLVEWSFVGWVFNGLPSLGANFITQSGGTPLKSLWAPYVLKVGSEYRLYYSLASNVFKLSVIGLATANTPEGPWTDKGVVVSSKNDAMPQTNAIDPSVIITPSGEHWMYYGSAFDGIHAFRLNPATGMALVDGDKGIRVAQRGFTGSTINGNIEAPEIIYNEDQKKYYLFISYDWLATKYNIRVGRSDRPEGPFYDYNNVGINTVQDHGPMILAPYQFSGHSGWQGTAHCAVFKDDAGQYYIAHQGRPGFDKYFMILHVRKIFWTQNGWPVVSPERYAWEDNAAVSKDSIIGEWERIKFEYNVVPGYENEQLSPDFQVAVNLTLDAAGTINGNAGSWSYAAPWLQLAWNNGSIEKVLVQKGRDWEKKKNSFVFTGLNEVGTAIWGKKK